MIEKEFEKKALITADEYHCIRKHLLKTMSVKSLLQINYYFDTPSFLLCDRNATLRIRQIGHHLQLQYKFNKENENGIWISDEYSHDITRIPNQITIDDVETEFVGVLTTQREQFGDCGHLICLDKSFYSGMVDYEIEIETPDSQVGMSAEIGIAFHFGGNSGKYKRFVESIRDQERLSIIRYT